ncbi:rRNA maturation RNase YbeY [Candidatus Mycoplasma pogonae]
MKKISKQLVIKSKNKLNFLNNTDYNFPYLTIFKQIVDEATLVLKIKKPIEVDFTLINNDQMQQIYKKYKSIDRSTDVLAFPSDWRKFEFMDFYPFGEIFISYQKVKEQAKAYNHKIKREFCYLFTHAIVHLYGLDHQTAEDEKKMNNYVNKIMKKINVLREN